MPSWIKIVHPDLLSEKTYGPKKLIADKTIRKYIRIFPGTKLERILNF